MLGRYLDSLPCVARERVCRAQRWTMCAYVNPVGARCMLGHAENWYWDDASQEPRCAAPDLLPLRRNAGDDWLNWPPLIGARYDHLVERIGLARTVALIKRRTERAATPLSDHRT